MSHVRDSFGTVIVTEFRRGFLAGIHSRDAGATGVMIMVLKSHIGLAPNILLADIVRLPKSPLQATSVIAPPWRSGAGTPRSVRAI